MPLRIEAAAWKGRPVSFELLTLALAIWSFRNALGGRKVLAEGFLEG